MLNGVNQIAGSFPHGDMKAMTLDLSINEIASCGSCLMITRELGHVLLRLKKRRVSHGKCLAKSSSYTAHISLAPKV